MNRRMGQLVVALVLFACAVILSYFSIEEKGGTQSADVMLVLDVSNSMNETGTTGEAKIEEAKSAALEFLGTIDPSFRIGLVTFSDDVRLISTLTKDKATIRAGINSLSAGGYTVLGDGIAAGVDELSSKGDPNAAKYIVLMTDGQPTKEISYSPQEAKDSATRNEVIVHSVGFGYDADQDLLHDISRATGGQYFFAATGQDLVTKFAEVAGVINQKLAYYYGSRGLIFISVILIIFLPEIVERTRMTLFRERDRPAGTRSYGGEPGE
jgi:Ca-activated chloride channel family protein